MPLARIFTRNPERTTDLSQQLQQQGYSVEVVSPDQAHLAPADLEIEFEVCERADVLERAGDLATELGADVAVAPGTLQPSVQPVAEPSRTAASVAESVVEMKTPAPAERDPEREFENAFAPVIEMPAAVQATPPVVEVPVMEQEPLPPVAFMDEPAAVEPIAMPKAPQPVAYSEPPRPADPMPYLSQLTPFSTPAARTPEAQKAPPEAPQISDRGKKTLQDGARIAARTWAGALALTSSTAASVRDHFHEYKKRAQVRSAEARAAHAARLLDLEQRRAEAQQRAAELEAAREEAAARLMELVRQRDPGLHEEIRHEAGVPAQSTHAEDRSRQVQPLAASARPPAFFKPARAAVPAPINPWRRINPPLRAVLTGAAAVSALFIMGIALGLFHSRTPLANPANHANTQSGGVTVQTGGVTVQTAPAKPQPGKPAAGAQAQAKPAQPNAGAPAQAAAHTPGKPSPRIQQAQHMVAQQSEKTIGDDVVIRHFSRPVPTEKPKQTGQQAGLKHFSDLEN
jgi:hypothetical protein